MAAVFRTFQDKKAAEGSLMTRYAQGRKCSKVRTKKREMLQKFTQKKSGDVFRKIRESSSKKRNFFTRYTHEGKSAKMHRNAHQKKKAEMQRKAEQKKSLWT